VARVGGDEFAVVLWQVNGALDAASVASKLLKTVSKQYGLRGRTVRIAISAGVAIYPAHGDDAATLLKSADLALHEAKHSGKNAYRVFDGETPRQRRGHLAAVRPLARVIGRIADSNR
jgi:diguanylate cyclase (GGDEF)-like protein